MFDCCGLVTLNLEFQLGFGLGYNFSVLPLLPLPPLLLPLPHVFHGLIADQLVLLQDECMRLFRLLKLECKLNVVSQTSIFTTLVFHRRCMLSRGTSELGVHSTAASSKFPNSHSQSRVLASAIAWCSASARVVSVAAELNSSRRIVKKHDIRYMKDEEFASCTICNAKFGFLLRKHHCRVCGVITCDSCSSFRKEACAICDKWVEGCECSNGTGGLSPSAPKNEKLRMCQKCNTLGGMNNSTHAAIDAQNAELQIISDSVKQLQSHGLGTDACSLLASGCNQTHLQTAGFDCSLAALKSAGCQAQFLKQAGFSAATLLKDGFSALELKKGGFDLKDLKAAGANCLNLKLAGFDCFSLHTAGFDLRALKAAGFLPSALKICDYDVAAMKTAGFTCAELQQAQYSAGTLLKEGFEAGDLRVAGFDAASLRAAGLSARILKTTGFNIQQLRDAGFQLNVLSEAGYTAKELRGVGFDAISLKNAGFDASALRASGFDAFTLTTAGCSLPSLKQAGFQALVLKSAGHDLPSLKAEGFDLSALMRAGFEIKDLRLAGFSIRDFISSGYSHFQELKKSGFEVEHLIAAGLCPLSPCHPHVFGIPFSNSLEFESLRPVKSTGATMNRDGLRFLGKFLSDSILTCHLSYQLYPYSALNIVSCLSLCNAGRLAAFEKLSGDCFVAVHGTTSPSNAASISDNGFRPSPAGCFGRGIYVAQNSSVAIVHTRPKGEDFESAGHFVAMKSKNNQPPPVLNLVVCFVKMRNYEKLVFPPKPVMEMIYNGFPSTAETLSSRDVVIGDMPFRFSEACVPDPNRVYAAWHVQVLLVPGLSDKLPYWNRAFNGSSPNLHFQYTHYSMGIIRLPNGKPAACRFHPDLLSQLGLSFALDKFLFAQLNPLQWAVVNRDFPLCAQLLRKGNTAFFEFPDFSLEELAETFHQYTFPKIPGVSHRGIQDRINDDRDALLAAAGLHARTIGQALQENMIQLLLDSKPDFPNPDSQVNHDGTDVDQRPLFYDRFTELIPVLKSIRESPSHAFDAAAEAKLVQACQAHVTANAKRVEERERRAAAQAKSR